MKGHNYCYDSGYQAYFAGQLESHCPHDAGTENAKQWLKGWKAAETRVMAKGRK